MKIAYICDRKKCERCSDSCHHTLDINHTKNFEKLCDDLGNVLAYQELDPVRHGKWIGYAGTIGNECSVCGKWIDVLQGTAEMNYCPNCGARMDEDE